MSTWLRTHIDDEATSAVEFGILLVPLVLIVFGIVEFGLYFSRMQGMQAAAREGGRVAAVALEFEKIEERVLEVAPPLIDPDHIEVSLDPAEHCVTGLIEETVEVTVMVAEGERAAYGLRIPFVPFIEEPTFESAAVFRCERQR